MFPSLNRLRLRFFPPVCKKRALQIAEQHVGRIEWGLGYCIHSGKPDNARIYDEPTEPSWYVFVPWNDGIGDFMLRSSRILAISKQTGKILFDGSANDEG